MPPVAPRPNPSAIEWPTIWVIVCCFSLLGVVIAFGDRWPLPITLFALAMLGAWYGSIQHEAVHGHPTPWPHLNLILTQLPLGLIYPYWLYRDLHLIHHRDEHLTDPYLDPESMYLSSQTWTEAGSLYRGLRHFNQTLIGRMLIGPVFSINTVLRDALRRLRVGDNRAGVARWAIAVTLILTAVDALGMPFWKFALGFGYFGLSVTLIRSFAEHRAVEDGSRSAVVHSRWFWGMLFLNVNLHLTHHQNPALAWYEVPRAHRNSDADQQAASGAGLYRSYPALIAKYLFSPIDRVPHPTPSAGIDRVGERSAPKP